VNEIRDAYNTAGPAWRDGPARMYSRLAAALLDHAPVPLEGARVLDVGAGTGVATSEARRRGAGPVVATDLAAGMLTRVEMVPLALADARALPFRDDAFDLVVEGFVLNHLADPVPALAEARRVAPAVAASTFDPAWEHPAKQVVDEVMASAGFVPPPWYVELQSFAPRGRDEVHAHAIAAGYRTVSVTRVEVAGGLNSPAAVVDWRWGMAHLAPFVATLDPGLRAELRARSEDVVTGLPPVVVTMLALSATR
jgi:SAM-dependent methyltransferase